MRRLVQEPSSVWPCYRKVEWHHLQRSSHMPFPEYRQIWLLKVLLDWGIGLVVFSAGWLTCKLKHTFAGILFKELFNNVFRVYVQQSSVWPCYRKVEWHHLQRSSHMPFPEYRQIWLLQMWYQVVLLPRQKSVP
jgi:hypothetical protein